MVTAPPLSEPAGSLDSPAGALPAGLPPIPSPVRTRGWVPIAATAAVGAAPMLLMLVSVVWGGGPRAESADDALITMITKDAIAGHQLLGPYSRFGWHHPGPSYFYLLSLPTWLWHGSPTGSWVGATAIGAACAVATVAAVRWWAGARAGWWAAVGAVAVVAGLGPGLLRDPWNPYVVTLPLLFVVVASAAGAAGAPGALPWALVVGSVAVQTHVSTAPVVVGLIVLAALVRGGRSAWRRAHDQLGQPTPARLPSPALPLADQQWWRYRPDLAIAVMALVAQWAPPVWDELFGGGNLHRLVAFFGSPHVEHGWADSWRLTTTIAGITMFQHHAAVADGVADPHPVVTTLVFAALAGAAIGVGVVRRRPLAIWSGAFGLAGGFLAVFSVTRVVDQPFHYLLLWMAVLPVLPVLGLAVALEGLRVRPGWLGSAATAGVVAAVSVLGLLGAADATPAAALTDRDVVSSWGLVARVVARAPGPVHLEIAAGGRWPAATGLGLELQRHGHPVRVDPAWTLLFGNDRRATGAEPADILVAGSDTSGWPSPAAATMLGEAGPDVIFARRSGSACWLGWLPFGGPACPAPGAPLGPAVPAPA